MALYELRTYTLYVGKMVEATKLYQELGFPALKNGGYVANKEFVERFAAKFRPLVMTQEVKLLTAAPWGPHS